MKFIPYEVKTGAENMQIDSDLLDFAISNNLEEPIFRLYGWSPACVSLGRNQNSDFLDTKFLSGANIDVVRRLTGGRALLHDKELTYSYICPVKSLKNGENVTSSYKEISKFLIEQLAKIGINVDFGGQKHSNTKLDYCMLTSTGADLCYQGKKLVGSAQCRKNGYILQHGSILLDYDTDLLERVFNKKVDTSQITSIQGINPKIEVGDMIKLFGNNCK